MTDLIVCSFKLYLLIYFSQSQKSDVLLFLMRVVFSFMKVVRNDGTRNFKNYSFTSWILTKPKIHLDLTKRPSVKNSTDIRHLKSPLEEYPDHIVGLIDGLSSKYETGYAYCISGSIMFRPYETRLGLACVIDDNLLLSSAYHSTTFKRQASAPHGLTLLPPFISWTLSQNPLVQRTLLILHSLTAVDCEITFIWIPERINLSERDAVDLTAKQVTFLPRITYN